MTNESTHNEAKRVKGELRSGPKGHRVMISISAIDTLQEMLGGLGNGSPTGHELIFTGGRRNPTQAWVWLA